MGGLEVGGFSLQRPTGLEEGHPGEAVPVSIGFIGTPHLFHLPARFPTLCSLKPLHQLSTLSPFQSLLSPRQPGCYSGHTTGLFWLRSPGPPALGSTLEAPTCGPSHLFEMLPFRGSSHRIPQGPLLLGPFSGPCSSSSLWSGLWSPLVSE